MSRILRIFLLIGSKNAMTMSKNYLECMLLLLIININIFITIIIIIIKTIFECTWKRRLPFPLWSASWCSSPPRPPDAGNVNVQYRPCFRGNTSNKQVSYLLLLGHLMLGMWMCSCYWSQSITKYHKNHKYHNYHKYQASITKYHLPASLSFAPSLRPAPGGSIISNCFTLQVRCWC